MNKLYWPNAIVLWDGKPQLMFTSSGLSDLNETPKVLKKWQDMGCIILSWWVKDNNQETVQQDICFNNAGQLIDLDGNVIKLNKTSYGA